MKACTSTNKFQTIVPALAKDVVEFFNKLIGIYSSYCTLLISSLSWIPQGEGPKPQYSSKGLTNTGGRNAGEACSWLQQGATCLDLLPRKDVEAAIQRQDLTN